MGTVTRISTPSKNSPPLLGVGGHLGAGKDALAEYIAKEFGATVLNMSAPLAKALLTLNPVIPQFVHSSSGKYVETGRTTKYRDLVESVGYVAAKKNPEVRRLLQVLGTQIGRDMISETVWVDLARKDIQALREDGEAVIITGIRFPNELEMIQGQGGTLVWVERDHEYASANVGAQMHASENSVSYKDFDITVENFGSLEDLYASASTLWAEERNKISRVDGPSHGTRYDW